MPPESVEFVATWHEGGEPVSEIITVPTDGTRVAFGADLPHGTEVTLTEIAPEAHAALAWDLPVWDAEGIVVADDGSATITIGAATDLEVAVTNNAVALLGSHEVRKPLSGDGAADMPASTVYRVTGGVITAGVLGVAALLIAGGAILLIRRRQDA